MAKVDMTGVAVGFETIPDMVTKARIIESKDVPAKDGKGTNVMVTFKLDTDDEYNGRQLSKWYSLKDTALWSYKTMLTYAGVAAEALEGEIDTDDFHPVIVGEEVLVSIGHHEAGDKTYNDIEVLDPATDLAAVGSGTSW